MTARDKALGNCRARTTTIRAMGDGFDSRRSPARGRRILGSKWHKRAKFFTLNFTAARIGLRMIESDSGGAGGIRTLDTPLERITV
jgi:hypothetical protein